MLPDFFGVLCQFPILFFQQIGNHLPMALRSSSTPFPPVLSHRMRRPLPKIPAPAYRSSGSGCSGVVRFYISVRGAQFNVLPSLDEGMIRVVGILDVHQEIM